jgi:hypothetical protein
MAARRFILPCVIDCQCPRVFLIGASVVHWKRGTAVKTTPIFYDQ